MLDPAGIRLAAVYARWPLPLLAEGLPLPDAVRPVPAGPVRWVRAATSAGGMGDVMVPIRGGSESYYAYASDPEETIPKGCRVVVLDQQAPRTIIVSRY